MEGNVECRKEVLSVCFDERKCNQERENRHGANYECNYQQEKLYVNFLQIHGYLYFWWCIDHVTPTSLVLIRKSWQRERREL